MMLIFLFFIFYIDLLHEAANNDDIESIYLLLLESGIKSTSLIFDKCTKLTQIAIPSNIEEIGDSSFNECSSLARISIPTSIKSIGSYAFSKCSSLECISIPSSITSIGSYAFNKCASLQKVIIPSSVKTIEFHAFDTCSSIKRVTIPPSITTIEDFAFNSCYNLQDISIPPNTSIKKNTFKSCFLLGDLCPNDKEMEEPSNDDSIVFFLVGCFILIPIICCLLAVFITAIVWWSRIHPWFSHAYKSGKTVYYSLETCWISALIIFILAILYYVSLCIFDKVKKYILKEYVIILIPSLFFLFLLVSLISGIVASCYALKNDKIDGESIKCLKYISDGYRGVSDWIVNQPLKKQNEFKNWYSNMLKKAYKKNGKVSNYYCFDVGIPILIFSIFPILLSLYILIIFLINLYRVCL